MHGLSIDVKIIENKLRTCSHWKWGWEIDQVSMVAREFWLSCSHRDSFFSTVSLHSLWNVKIIQPYEVVPKLIFTVWAQVCAKDEFFKWHVEDYQESRHSWGWHHERYCIKILWNYWSSANQRQSTFWEIILHVLTSFFSVTKAKAERDVPSTTGAEKTKGQWMKSVSCKLTHSDPLIPTAILAHMKHWKGEEVDSQFIATKCCAEQE